MMSTCLCLSKITTINKVFNYMVEGTVCTGAKWFCRCQYTIVITFMYAPRCADKTKKRASDNNSNKNIRKETKWKNPPQTNGNTSTTTAAFPLLTSFCCSRWIFILIFT